MCDVKTDISDVTDLIVRNSEYTCDSTSIYASIYISNKCFTKGLACECDLAS